MQSSSDRVPASSSWFSPAVYVLLVIAMQAVLLGGYFYLAQQGRLQIESDELHLLIGYCVITVMLAIIIAVVRHRWTQRENRIRQRILDVIDAIPDPSAVRDVKGRYVLWNKAAEVYYGIKASYVIGKTPFELFPPAFARTLLELDAQCAEENQAVVRRVELPSLYGKPPRIAQIRVAPVRAVDSETSIRGAVTILHDITASEQETIELRNTAAQLKVALDASGFGPWEWILEDNIIRYGEGYARLLRYTGKDFGKDFAFEKRLHPEDIQRVKDAVVASLKGQANFDIQYQLLCFDGVYRNFRSSGEARRLENGKTNFAGLLCPLD